MVTNGWDTVYALSFDCLNQQFATDSLTFPNQVQVSGPSSPFTIQATLGAWKASTGGSAQLLNVQIPVVSGTLADQDKGSFDLSGIVLSYDLSLEMLSQPNSLSLSLSIPTLSAVQVLQPGPLSELQQVGLLAGVASYLGANAKAINYAFASVDLGAQSGTSWLTPKACNYTTFDNFLVILASVHSSDISKLTPTADSTMLAPGNTAAMLIDPGCFLEYGVMPTLPGQLGIPASPMPFALSPTTSPAIICTQVVSLPPVKVGAINYSPKLMEYNMSLVGAVLTTEAVVTCSLKLGIEAGFSITTINSAGYNPATGSLEFTAAAKPVVTRSTKTPILDEILSAILGEVIEGMIPIVVSAISNSLAKALAESNLSSLPAESVTWAAAGKFNVTTAGIGQSVYFQGTWQ
jgi:hypothetical protein